jgi:hypothetical protein
VQLGVMKQTSETKCTPIRSIRMIANFGKVEERSPWAVSDRVSIAVYKVALRIRPPRRRVSNFAQMPSVTDYLERLRPADVVPPHIHKIKQLQSVHRRHP